MRIRFFISLIIFAFLVSGISAASQCAMTLTSAGEVDGELAVSIKVRIDNPTLLNEPLLLYCDDSGGYPRPVVCRDEICDMNCRYPVQGDYRASLVAQPENQNAQCSELCSAEVVVGETSDASNIEGYRLMDACLNGHLFIANGGNNSITVVDMAIDRIVDTIPVGRDPRGVRCNQATGEVWITNWGSGTIQVIDSETHEFVTERPIRSCINPWGVDFSVDGSKAFVACWGGKADDWCSSFEVPGLEDALTDYGNTAGDTFNLDSGPSDFLADLRAMDSKMKAPGAVVSLNTTTKEIIGTLKVESTINGGPWASKGCGDFLFITNDGTDSVTVIDPDSFSIAGTINVGEVPWDVTCDWVRGKLYVANGGANDQNQKSFWDGRVGEASLSVIDVNSLKEEARVPLGFDENSEPWATAVDPETGKVYVVDMFDKGGSIHVVDVQTSSQTGELLDVGVLNTVRDWNGKFCRGIGFFNGKVYGGCTGGGQKISSKGSLYAYADEGDEPGSIPVLDASTMELLDEIDVSQSSRSRGTSNKIALLSGWNLISVDGGISSDTLYNSCGVKMVWSFENGEYKKVDTLKSSFGYWVFADSSCTVNIELGTTDSSRTLASGWNLISSQKSWSEIKGDCERASNFVYSYDSSELRYRKLDDRVLMSSELGYWVKVKSPCTLNL